MRLLALLFFCLSLSASAQNWALLNPAYKYNYSNDGTDTISNQVFVTHIDTLGPDSFRYELNRIGVVCDTCGFDNWYLRVNQPGTLGLTCLLEPNGTWTLQGGGNDRIIRPEATVGQSWTYDTGNSITATITTITQGSLFGQLDSLKTITLSNGDSIVISRNYGVLMLPGPVNGTYSSLIGIDGPELGHQLPDASTMFALDIGDVVQYRIYHWLYDQGPGLFTDEQRIKYTITGRQEYPDSVVLSFTYAGRRQKLYSWSDPMSDTIHTSGSDAWQLPDASYMFQGLGLAYPGEVVNSVNWPWYQTGLLDTNYLAIARYGIDPAGTPFIRADRFADLDQPLGPDTYARLPQTEVVHVEYRPPFGLYSLSINSWNFNQQIQRQISVQGSVIGGDTTGTVNSDGFLLGLSNIPSGVPLLLSPNPVAEQLTIRCTDALQAEWLISDIAGQAIRTGRFTSSTLLQLDISTIPPGIYFFSLDTAQGRATRRFIIAR